jgi:hypothetical protein
MSISARHLQLKNVIHAEAEDATLVIAAVVRCSAIAVVKSPNARPAFRTISPSCHRQHCGSIFGLMLATWTFGMASVTAAVSRANIQEENAIASTKIVAA